jgi:UDP-glucose 4-epimerase
MSVLITGGAGYIGSHMVLMLLEAGEEVIVIDDLSTGFRESVSNKANLIVGDIGDENLIRKTIHQNKVNEIIDFAGDLVVPESIRDPLIYYRNNVSKTRLLIATAIETGIKNFIFSSSCAVYGEIEKKIAHEDDTLTPLSPYGRSKLMVEWILEDVARAYDFTYVALRYFNVAGADPLGRVGESKLNPTVITKMAVQAALGVRPSVVVFGNDYPTEDGTCVRDYVQVTDLCFAHFLALEYLRKGGESQVLNCGYMKGFSVLEVINAVKRVSETDFKVEFSKRRIGDPASVIADNTKIRQLLKWKPHYDNLDIIVTQALLWEKHLQKLSIST